MYQVPSDKCAVDANQGLSPGGLEALALFLAAFRIG